MKHARTSIQDINQSLAQRRSYYEEGLNLSPFEKGKLIERSGRKTTGLRIEYNPKLNPC